MDNSNQQRYGFFTMISMVIGIVIGSGIFFVNGSLFSQTDSTGLSIIGWIVVSLIVLMISVAFIEITSATSILRRAGTVNNLTKLFWNEKLSKYTGGFFAFIYLPTLLAAFSILAADQLNQAIDVMGGSTQIYGITSEWSSFIFSTIFAIVIMAIFFWINTLTSKPGKIFQQFGTVIKMVPLFLIIFLGFFVVLGLINSDVDNLDSIMNPNSELNNGWNDGLSALKVIILISPTIMFSYDGFLFAASLQGESKKPSTYKMALISGMIIIILLYIVTSIFVFAFSNVENSFSVPQAILSIFPNAQWLASVIYIIIFISVLTSFSGVFVVFSRNITDFSISNEISDPNGNLLARNRAGVPQNSAIFAIIITIVFFVVFRILDASIIGYSQNDPNSDYNTLGMTSIALNMNTLFIFVIYGFLIVGAIVNRFTNKVETEKGKLFFPSSFISLFFMAITIVIYTISLFDLNFDSNYNLIVSILTLVYTFVTIFIVVAVAYLLTKNSSKINDEQIKEKEKLIQAYNEQKVDPRYIK